MTAEPFVIQSMKSPPFQLVGGSGAYANALARVLGVEAISSQILDQGPRPLKSGGYPTVFDSVKHVLLVVEEVWSVAEVVWRHDQVWRWIDLLTSGAEYHEAGFIFVLGERAPSSVEASLALALGLTAVDCAKGVAVWRRSEPLKSLVKLLLEVRKTDLQTMRTRRLNQPKHQALSYLKVAIDRGDCTEIHDAARAVRAQFRDDGHSIDNFCTPPFHQNGNAWRKWLAEVVTEGVTPECRGNALKMLPTLNV